MSKRWPSSKERAQREVLPLSLALYHAARDYQGGIKAVAVTFGLNPITLQHKLSPTHEPHKPNLEDLEAVLSVTRDERIMDSIGEMAGGGIWVAPCSATSETPMQGMMATLSVMQDRVAEMVRTLSESLEDGVISPLEAAELHLRVRRLMGAALAIEAAADQYAEARHG
jgi:hypothetical protein